MKKLMLSAFMATISTAYIHAGTTTVPADLEATEFAGPDLVPCPAVICAAPTGEVYVGVDLQGSLGKKPNLGKIIKLIDTNNDGKADKHTEYAKIDNPRGLIAIGDKLYCLHCTQTAEGLIDTQQLSVFTDANGDGVADGPAKALVTNIGNPKFLKIRGTDHSTNGIRLAVDGWIYISVGDYGFIGAEGTDGTKLSMHGGGIVRVRPDGSELETFVHGTRNVYDVTIDPFMNVFTRENTNDGVGWWVRFSHYIQSGEYGYPSLYTNFPEDMIPALGEYGSGSGTGNMFLQEPGWPAQYNNAPLMGDWGKSSIFIHRTVKDGASFTQKPEKFISSTQLADFDVDGSGRMYIAAWDGAGYKGNPNKGFVSRVVPKGGDWKFKPFPNLVQLKSAELVKGLESGSITTRMYMQQEILRRNDTSLLPDLVKLAQQKTLTLESRVAAVYTLAQLTGENAMTPLAELSKDDDLREHAIRCMADRKKFTKSVDLKLLISALKDANPRVQVAAAVALGRVGDLSAAEALISCATPPAPKKATNVVKKKTGSVVKGKQTAKIDQDITGYAELYLIIGDEGNKAKDHAAWINPAVTLKNGKKIDLTKVKWKKATQGWSKSQINKSSEGKPLKDHSGKLVSGIGTHANSVIIYKMPKQAVRFTATGILTNSSGKVNFSVSKDAPAKKMKIHSTPNPDMLLPHVARQALLALNAEDACIVALNSGDAKKESAALATMKFMHSDKVVDALIVAAKNPALKEKVTKTLVRLHQKEIEYDGSTWWNTRPNPTGPYYYPVDWSSSAKISSYLNELYRTLDDAGKAGLKKEIVRNRAYVGEINPRPKPPKPPVDKLVKDASIEDLVVYVGKHKGNAGKGAKLLGKLACATCHNMKKGDAIKGPDLAKLGKVSRADITESIIKPAAIIAKSWVNVIMEDGTAHLGTIVKKDAKEIVLHGVTTGLPTTLDATKVKKIEPGMPMMGEGLCDHLTLPEFADLITYIQSMDPAFKGKK